MDFAFDLASGRMSNEMGPLFEACETDDVNRLELILKEGLRTFAGVAKVDVDRQDSDGFSPIMIASACGSVKCAKLLVERNANLSMRTDEFESTALHFAAKFGNLEVRVIPSPVTRRDRLV